MAEIFSPQLPEEARFPLESAGGMHSSNNGSSTVSLTSAGAPSVPHRPKLLQSMSRISGESVLQMSIARRCVRDQILESQTYECLLAIIIVFNALVIIREVDARSLEEDELYDGWLKRLGWAFLTFYIIEVALRLWVYQWKFFKQSSNLLDLFVVGTDIVTTTAELLFAQEVPSLAFLRILRLVRLARFVHILMVFKELHMMLHALTSALRTIVWATFMLAILLTLWSIIAVEVLHPVNKDLEYDDCPRCPTAFQTVLESNLTFIQTIIAGDSWGTVSLPIMQAAPHTALVLLSALVSINLGVLNLILTVIVNAAQEARNSDEKLRIQERDLKFKKLRRRLEKLCRLLDVDGDEQISYNEMESALQTYPEFRETLEAMDLGVDDLQIFFSYLDKDGSGDVSYREFVDQVFRLKTQDSASMMIGIRGSLSHLHAKVDQRIGEVQRSIHHLSKHRHGPLSHKDRRFRPAPSHDGTKDTRSPRNMELDRSTPLLEGRCPTFIEEQSEDGAAGKMMLHSASTTKKVPTLRQATSKSSEAAFNKSSESLIQQVETTATVGGATAPPQRSESQLQRIHLQVDELRIRLDSDLAFFIDDLMLKIEDELAAHAEDLKDAMFRPVPADADHRHGSKTPCDPRESRTRGGVITLGEDADTSALEKAILSDGMDNAFSV